MMDMGVARPSAHGQAMIRALPARHRSRNTSSCHAVRRSPRHPYPQSPSSVPAPCRTWGNRRDVPAALRDALGTGKWLCLAASVRALRWGALAETSAGSGHRKSGTPVHHARYVARTLRPPSYRRLGRWSCQNRSLHRRVANPRLFPGPPANDNDHQEYHQNDDQRPHRHPSSPPVTTPSICMIH
jgi:hypothetical protein